MIDGEGAVTTEGQVGRSAHSQALLEGGSKMNTVDMNSAEPESVALDADSDPTEESDQRTETVKYGGWHFTAPVSLQDAKVPAKPGLFVILVRERFWASREFEPIDFGESANLYRRLMVDGDD